MKYIMYIFGLVLGLMLIIPTGSAVDMGDLIGEDNVTSVIDPVSDEVAWGLSLVIAVFIIIIIASVFIAVSKGSVGAALHNVSMRSAGFTAVIAIIGLVFVVGIALVLLFYIVNNFILS